MSPNPASPRPDESATAGGRSTATTIDARRILVLGATGGVGRHVVEQATGMGLDVTVLVRARDRLPATALPIKVVVGDIRQESDAVREAFANQDAVISALGVGKSFKPDGLIAQAASVIVAAMRRQGVRRLIVTSAFGVGDTWQDAPLLPRLFILTLLRQVYRDKAAGDEVVRTSGLDWTIVHPTGLTDRPGTGSVRVGERLKLTGFPTVARADVAAVLLQQLEDTAHIRKGILVSN